MSKRKTVKAVIKTDVRKLIDKSDKKIVKLVLHNNTVLEIPKRVNTIYQLSLIYDVLIKSSAFTYMPTFIDRYIKETIHPIIARTAYKLYPIPKDILNKFIKINHGMRDECR